MSRVSPAGLKKIILLLQLLSLCVVMGVAQTARQDEGEGLPEGAQYLPAGEGRRLILQGCVQCHDLRNTAGQRKREAAWRRTVNEMIWRGAPLMADEAETIIKYLAEELGPDKPLPDALKRRPSGEQR